jgi:plastocyanin
MFDTLDSRVLRYTDCYGQRFMKVGTYHYGVRPASETCASKHGPFTVKVIERSNARMKQHSVVVRVDAGRFTVEPQELTIDAGDLVLWNCPESTAIAYVVAGISVTHRCTL